MKIIQDNCSTSINILQQKISKYLLENIGTANTYFIDYQTSANVIDQELPINIIFFGSFLRKFLESKAWHHDKYKFWVLCQQAKNIFHELLNIDNKYIAVIPRYELFPKSNTQTPFPDLHNKCTFVYAGRISPTKNIETIIRTTYFLQQNHSYLIKLVLCGNFDNDCHPSYGEEFEDNFSIKIKKLINDLEWTIRPQIINNLSSEEWPKQNFENPILFNLSTYMCEDFGVSIAQAQTFGWPCLISKWGGNCDVVGNNVVKIPVKSIPHSHEHQEIIIGKSFGLANIISDLCNKKDLLTVASDEHSTPRSNTPQTITINAIDRARNKFIQTWGPEAYLIPQKQIPEFSSKSVGKIFFNKYNDLFAGAKSVNTKIITVFINDLQYEKNEITHHVPLLCRLLSAHFNSLKSTLNMVSIKEIALSHSLEKILSSSEIIFTFYYPPMFPLLEFLINNLKVQCRIKIFISKDQLNVSRASFANLLSTEDLITFVDNESLQTIELGEYPNKQNSQTIAPPKEKNLFSNIEIEINHSCNQSCTYCPNSQYERIEKGEMSLDLFKKLLNQLQEINYHNVVSFHFYNEPLLCSNLNTIISLTKNALPKCKIDLFSNGLILSKKLMNELIDLGVDRFSITNHLNSNSSFIESVYDKLSKQQKSFVRLITHESLSLYNRGGLLPEITTSIDASSLACFIPSNLVVVTLRGNVLPCYEDFQQKNVMGNITNNHIKDIWNTKKYKLFRRDLEQKKRKNYSTCVNCNNSKLFP